MPVICESDTVKFETERDVTAKLGSCGCITNQAIPITAIKMTKTDTTVQVRRRIKPVSKELLDGILLVEGCSIFITSDKASIRRYSSRVFIL
ncbi:NDR1/HIN1 protein [Trifolium repens]|nr:NDR1/HIN1 protein [Trifolium repens]